MHPKEEKTFLMLKPDSVKRGLIGEIIARVEKVGLKVVALQMFLPTHEQMDNHYPKDEAWITRLGEKTLKTYNKHGIDAKAELGTDKAEEIGPMIRKWLISYMTSAPLVKMVIEGIHSVEMVRKMVGSTFPADADVGTIRGDYSVESPLLANMEKRAVANMVHASETPEEAKHEIEHWFAPEEINDYKRTSDMI